MCAFALRAVFFLAFLLFFLFFFPFLPFFDFDLNIVCFILSFSCGYYAVSSVSVSAATRLACDILLYIFRIVIVVIILCDVGGGEVPLA